MDGILHAACGPEPRQAFPIYTCATPASACQRMNLVRRTLAAASIAAAICSVPCAADTASEGELHQQRRRQRMEVMEKIAAEQREAWARFRADADRDGVVIDCESPPEPAVRWILFSGYVFKPPVYGIRDFSARLKLSEGVAEWWDISDIRRRLRFKDWVLESIAPGPVALPSATCRKQSGEVAAILAAPPDFPYIR